MALAEGARREAWVATPGPEESQPDAAGGVLVVHARWSDGFPAEGEVVLATPRTRRADEALAARTGSDGTARFDGLEPGPVDVRLLRGGEDTAQVSLAREAEVTLRISTGVTVEGRVIDAHGEPVQGAEIWLSERYRADLGHVLALSAAGGEFTLREVGPDHYLGARKRGLAPSELRSLRGRDGDSLGLELVLAQAGATARGVVLDERGAPIAGARVLLGLERPPSVRLPDGSFAPGPPPQRTETGLDGRFELETVALGLQPLQVRSRGCAPFAAPFEVLEAGGNEVVVTLAPEARVTGSSPASASITRSCAPSTPGMAPPSGR
jgi:hypothetical protein